MRGDILANGELRGYRPAPIAIEPGAVAPGSSYTQMVFKGGPVLAVPELIGFYWGNFTAAEISTMQNWLAGFAGYLCGAGAPVGTEQVVRQYGVTGATVGPHVQDASAPSTATEQDVRNKIEAHQANGTLPGYGPQRLFLAFTKGVTFSGYNTVWCAYHGSWGPGKYFAICPQLTGGCAGTDPLASWQGVVAHEVLEAATDPVVGAGWVEGNEEGGDSCNRQFAPVSFGTTQRFADNLQQACSVWTMLERPDLAATAWSANRLDIFVRGTDGAVWHKWWNGAAWGGFESLGGQIVGAPAVVSWGPNRLDVFVRGTDGAMYHKWWDGSAWGPSVTGWEDLGGFILGAPKAVSWAPNRLDIFAQGGDGALYHKWWNGSAWGGWESLGGQIIGAPEAVAWGPNRLDVFVRGTDFAMYHKWWDGGAWGPSLTGFESLGGVLLSDVSATSWAANRLDVFGRGTDGAMYHRWWNGAAWGGWESLGGVIVGAPDAVAWGPNRLDTFARGTDGAMYHKWWDGSAWGPSVTGWEDLGGVIIGAPIAVSWASNRLDVFGQGTDNAMYHKWWDGHAWGGWENLGGVLG
jgi:hypothetical protein